jgi:hypothetical protein
LNYKKAIVTLFGAFTAGALLAKQFANNAIST